MQPPPPWLPFPEYVLRALEHPPHMFVSKLAACCTILFLTRSDPDLLRLLCHKWAIRFTKDRPKLIARIRRRAYDPRSRQSVDDVIGRAEDLPETPKLCDPDACVEHFLRLVNTLVPMYFSWNWHRTEDVIRINKEYEAYVKMKILPICANTEAEEGEDDTEEMVSLLPLEVSSDAIDSFMSPVVNQENSFNGTSVVGNGTVGNLTYPLFNSHIWRGLSLVTIGNLREVMHYSINGLILIFHAKYSVKSTEALVMFQDILMNRLIDPAPNVCVVHTVTEPELAEMYDISWFPTIIFTPPKYSIEKVNSGNRGGDVGGGESVAKMTDGGLSRNFNGSLSLSSPKLPKENGTNASRRSSSVRSLSQAAFAVARCKGELTPSEVLYGVHHEADMASLSPTLHSSEESNEDGLASIIANDGHCVYPSSAVMTTKSLVEWIKSAGKVIPQAKNQNAVNRIKVLFKNQMFKKQRERLSSSVMLRQFQCSSEGRRAPPSEESPMFIFLGGGMAAGKSTAAMALSQSKWWAKQKENSVLVSADDFKVVDPSMDAFSDIQEVKRNLHELSTRAAENLLVKAVNAGRSIVFDSTMMWRPFVKQTVDMVRNAHTTIFKQGVGYQKGGQLEEYFLPLTQRSVPLPKPYEIHLLAITVEPETAVPRGILRKLSTGRGVPISQQLRSFRLFAESFKDYISWVDSARLYNNNVFVDLQKGELPPIIAEKSPETKNSLKIFDGVAFKFFERQRQLKDDADNLVELYENQNMSLRE